MEGKELEVIEEPKEYQANQEEQDPLGPRVMLDHLEKMAHQDPPALRVSRDLVVRMATWDDQASLEHLVCQENLDLKVHEEKMVNRDK